jgi:phosphonopyruvate decarboxylase
VVKKKTFLNYEKKNKKINSNLFLREEALEILLNQINDNSIIVSTTGKTSREIFELRKMTKQPHNRDFLTVGSMGHCSSIALGIALSNNKRKVFCIDGDGSMIMHMGALTTLAQIKPKNFFHILLNNRVHESVGGQKTTIKHIDLKSLIKSNSYENFLSIDKKEMLVTRFKKFVDYIGPSFIEILIDPGSRENLGRPTESPITNKINLMSYIKKTN